MQEKLQWAGGGQDLGLHPRSLEIPLVSLSRVMSRVRDAGKLQDLVSTHAVSSGDVSSSLGDESLSTSTILHFYMSTQHAALQHCSNC